MSQRTARGWRISVVLGGSIIVAVATVAPMLGLSGGSTGPRRQIQGGSIFLLPHAGNPGSTFRAGFPCTGLATLAVTTAEEPLTLVWSGAIEASRQQAEFHVPVPPDQPPGELRVVGVCARHGSGYQGYDGYDGYQGYDGYDDACSGYDGYQGYQGYDGYEGYDGYGGSCGAIVTFGPSFFRVNAPFATTTSTSTTTSSSLPTTSTTASSTTTSTPPTSTTTAPAGPMLSIDDLTVVEKDGSPAKARFTINLSAPTAMAVRVDYATLDGSATDGTPISEGKDYVARSTSMVLAAGTTAKQVEISVVGDCLDEADEQFSVVLSNARNAGIARATGTATIVDDDPITVSVRDASVVEGDSGTQKVTVRFELSRPSDRTVNVKYSTEAGSAIDAKTATDGKDFTARRGSFGIDRGTTSAAVSITVAADRRVEGNEAFFVVLTSSAQADIGDGEGVVTIVDDD